MIKFIKNQRELLFSLSFATAVATLPIPAKAYSPIACTISELEKPQEENLDPSINREIQAVPVEEYETRVKVEKNWREKEIQRLTTKQYKAQFATMFAWQWITNHECRGSDKTACKKLKTVSEFLASSEPIPELPDSSPDEELYVKILSRNTLAKCNSSKEKYPPPAENCQVAKKLKNWSNSSSRRR